MIIAHLIGGNEIVGIREGIVIVNGEQLKTSYQELGKVCGNISLGDLDTSVSERRTEKHIEQEYIKLVKEFDEDIADSFVIDNHLTKEVCYSSYEIDFENKTLVLKIDSY